MSKGLFPSAGYPPRRVHVAWKRAILVVHFRIGDPDMPAIIRSFVLIAIAVAVVGLIVYKVRSEDEEVV
jgi:hypothetical protein